MHDLTIHHIPVADLALLPGNPRQGDVGAVVESMRTNGVYQPIIVNQGTHTGRPLEVIAGNHRAQAARQLGMTTVPAILLNLDDDAATRIALADNRTSDLADYDTAALVVMLQSLDGYAGTGYDGDDLDDLLRDLAGPPEKPTPTPSGPTERLCPSCGYDLNQGD
ncbi:ParB/RepB/Spo0J family partition protein [Brachybacterium sp. NPDC056505]|uniref:ParB/RepB/Spo0J family partition protein n=1 Tax=Brachybacterium sp. NPDC056505 TaxID=3345843 RepID=UPI003671CFD6